MDHEYEGLSDGRYCTYDPWEAIDAPVDFCGLPESAHSDQP